MEEPERNWPILRVDDAGVRAVAPEKKQGKLVDRGKKCPPGGEEILQKGKDKDESQVRSIGTQTSPHEECSVV